MYECYLGDSCKETLATRTMGNTGIAGSELAESATEMMQMFGTEAGTIDKRSSSALCAPMFIDGCICFLWYGMDSSNLNAEYDSNYEQLKQKIGC